MVAKIFAALALNAAALAPVVGQDTADAEGEPLRCVSMASIRSTRIVDDRTVLFFHGRGNVYVNRLERECIGLSRNGKFTYQVQTGARHARLCATDTITVLERTGRGFNCGLGPFEPISRDEADAFMGGPNRAVQTAPVELPKEPAAEPALPAEPVPPTESSAR